MSIKNKIKNNRMTLFSKCNRNSFKRYKVYILGERWENGDTAHAILVMNLTGITLPNQKLPQSQS